MSRRHLQHSNPQTPNITRTRTGLSLEEFWGHPVGRTNCRHAMGGVVVNGRAPKVPQLAPPLSRKQDVGPLNIPMDNSKAVDVLQPQQHILHVPIQHIFCERPQTLHHIPQRPHHKLQHKIQILFHLHIIHHFHNSGMTHLLQHLQLTLQPLSLLLWDQPPQHLLHRHQRPIPRIHPLVHNPHSPTPQPYSHPISISNQLLSTKLIQSLKISLFLHISMKQLAHLLICRSFNITNETVCKHTTAQEPDKLVKEHHQPDQGHGRQNPADNTRTVHLLNYRQPHQAIAKKACLGRSCGVDRQPSTWVDQYGSVRSKSSGRGYIGGRRRRVLQCALRGSLVHHRMCTCGFTGSGMCLFRSNM